MNILTTLEKLGGLLQGHFVLKSGRHSDQYLNKDVIYPHVNIMQQIGEAIADLARTNHLPFFDVVIGPEKGGIILAQWTAFALRNQECPPLAPDICNCETLVVSHGRIHNIPPRNQECPPLALYAEKTDTGFTFKRGYDQLLHNQQILLVEDILTTGGSIQAVTEATQQAGGTVIGTIALVNRGNVQLPNLYTLATMQATSWTPEECPLCKTGVPINTNVGHGKK